MAGVGEASAIVTLIGIAPQISKAVIEAASNYKHARSQIESFGREVCLLGEILGRLRDVLFVDNNNNSSSSNSSSSNTTKSQLEPGVKTLLSQILGECNEMFSQLNDFSDKLHAKPNALQNVSRRGKMKWVLGDKTELEYLRARVDSMKINILLMMTLQAVQNHKSSHTKSEENAKSIVKLSQENEACIRRLQMLENEGAHVEEHVRGKISSTMSVVSAETAGTAASIQSNSTWNSIFRAYGWTLQKDQKPPTDNAKSYFGLAEKQEQDLELSGIGGHSLLQIRDPKMEDGQLEKLGLVPSSLDGNTKVPAWLDDNSPHNFLVPRLRHPSDEKADRSEALLAIIDEEMKRVEMKAEIEAEDWMGTEDEMETGEEMESEGEMESGIIIQKLDQNTLVPISSRKHTLSYSESLEMGDPSCPVPAPTSSSPPPPGSPPYHRHVDGRNDRWYQGHNLGHISTAPSRLLIYSGISQLLR